MSKLKSIKIVRLITIGLVLVSYLNGNAQEYGPESAIERWKEHNEAVQEYEKYLSIAKEKEVFNWRLLSNSEYDEYYSKYQDECKQNPNKCWEIHDKYFPLVPFDLWNDFHPVKVLIYNTKGEQKTWVYPSIGEKMGEIKFYPDGRFTHVTNAGYPVLDPSHPKYGNSHRFTHGYYYVMEDGIIKMYYDPDDARKWGWVYQLEDYIDNPRPKISSDHGYYYALEGEEYFVHYLEFKPQKQEKYASEFKKERGHGPRVQYELQPSPLMNSGNLLFPADHTSVDHQDPYGFQIHTVSNNKYRNKFGFYWIKNQKYQKEWGKFSNSEMNFYKEMNLGFYETNGEYRDWIDWSQLVYKHIRDLGYEDVRFSDNRVGLAGGQFVDNRTGKYHQIEVEYNRSGKITDVSIEPIQ